MRIHLKYFLFQKFLILLLCILQSKFLISQDVHFSQFNASVINLNPAFTGFFDGDYRISGIYRSQWSSVPVPYKSFSFAGDMRLKTKKMKRNCFGIGIIFNNDQAGESNYGANQLYLSGSYIYKLNKDSTILWTSGIMMGISNVGFNYSKMTFDDQYQNGIYTSSNGTGENFNKNSTTFWDFNIGTAFQYAIKQRSFLQYGISYYHFTNPKLTFQNNNASKIDTKLNNYICFAYPIGAKTDIITEIFYSHQGKYNEIISGAQAKFHLDEKRNQFASIGLYYRAKDAIISRLGYQIKTLTAGVSYDLNTSKFIAATNRRGGFEFYVTYIFKKVILFVPRTRVCPIYM